MPKLKTHKGAAKRFYVTGKGRILRNRANRRHLLTGKSAKRIRELRQKAAVDDTQSSSIKSLLPYM